jgi:hypothetical protein
MSPKRILGRPMPSSEFKQKWIDKHGTPAQKAAHEEKVATDNFMKLLPGVRGDKKKARKDFSNFWRRASRAEQEKWLKKLPGK